MEYVTLGGLRVSKIGLGAWQFGEAGWGWGMTLTEADAEATLQAAFDAGINLIDTAEVYGRGISEQVVGRFIRKVGREKVVIATKVSGQHLRHDDVLRAAEGSLSRLGVSTIDLYQVHWHNAYVSLRQTMLVLEDLVDRGMVRSIGVSNFSRPLLEDARRVLSRHPLVANQVRYNLLYRDIEEEILPYCREYGITIIAYSPLAQGILTGKFPQAQLAEEDLRRESPLFNAANLERAAALMEALTQVARRYDKTPGQVALKWLIDQADLVAIPGAKSAAQAIENAGAAGWRLAPEDAALLDQASRRVQLSYFV